MRRLLLMLVLTTAASAQTHIRAADITLGNSATSTTKVSTSATAPRTVVLPDANSVTIQPTTCSAGQFVAGVSSTGVISCSASGPSAYCPNMPTTASRHTMIWQANGSTATGTWLGNTMSVNNGSAFHTSENTGSVPSAPDYTSYSSTASAGTAAGLGTSVSFTTGDTTTHKANLYVCVRARISSTTSTRICLGFIDNGHHWPFGNQCQRSFFASSQTFAFHYDTANGDTTWQLVTDNGNATANFVNTAQAPDTNWHWFEILNDDSVPNSKFYYDGVLLSTETSKIPAAGQQLEFDVASEATAAIVARIDVAEIVIQANYP